MASIPNKGLPGRITPHPGEFLGEMPEELGVAQTTSHRRTGMSMQRISEIVNG
jgi:plasmid maintenance system antidote protein VapI